MGDKHCKAAQRLFAAETLAAVAREAGLSPETLGAWTRSPTGRYYLRELRNKRALRVALESIVESALRSRYQ